MDDQDQRKEQWRARIADYKASGQTMKVWCEAQGLTLHQLKYWLYKSKITTVKKTAPTTGKWLSLNVAKATAEANPSPLVVRVGQTAIEVRQNFDADLLRQVVRTLESSC